MRDWWFCSESLCCRFRILLHIRWFAPLKQACSTHDFITWFDWCVWLSSWLFSKSTIMLFRIPSHQFVCLFCLSDSKHIWLIFLLHSFISLHPPPSCRYDPIYILYYVDLYDFRFYPRLCFAFHQAIRNEPGRAKNNGSLVDLSTVQCGANDPSRCERHFGSGC